VSSAAASASRCDCAFGYAYTEKYDEVLLPIQFDSSTKFSSGTSSPTSLRLAKSRVWRQAMISSISSSFSPGSRRMASRVARFRFTVSLEP
jgi:hypothetical protein